jgi:hypothetical protein
MYQQLWGYKVEKKLYLGVREQKRLNTTGLEGRGPHLNLSTLTSTTIVVLFASKHRHKMSTGSSKDQTVYKHVKEHYPI